MASKDYSLNTWYAKRIIGDAGAATNALLQLTNNDTLILTNDRATLYGIKYKYDSNGTADKIEFYGGQVSNSVNIPTAWVQMNTGEVHTKGNIYQYISNINLASSTNGLTSGSYSTIGLKIYDTTSPENTVGILTFNALYSGQVYATLGAYNIVNSTSKLIALQALMKKDGSGEISFQNTIATYNGTQKMLSCSHDTTGAVTIELNGETRPQATNVYDLGTSTYKWKNIYASQHIMIKDEVADISTSNNGLSSGSTIPGFYIYDKDDDYIAYYESSIQSGGRVNTIFGGCNNVNGTEVYGQTQIQLEKNGQSNISWVLSNANNNNSVRILEADHTSAGIITIQANANTIPKVTSAYTLGSLTNLWTNIYGEKLSLVGTGATADGYTSTAPYIEFKDSNNDKNIRLGLVTLNNKNGLILAEQNNTWSFLQLQGNLIFQASTIDLSKTNNDVSSGSLSAPILFYDINRKRIGMMTMGANTNGYTYIQLSAMNLINNEEKNLNFYSRLNKDGSGTIIIGGNAALNSNNNSGRVIECNIASDGAMTTQLNGDVIPRSHAKFNLGSLSNVWHSYFGYYVRLIDDRTDLTKSDNNLPSNDTVQVQALDASGDNPVGTLQFTATTSGSTYHVLTTQNLVNGVRKYVGIRSELNKDGTGTIYLRNSAATNQDIITCNYTSTGNAVTVNGTLTVGYREVTTGPSSLTYSNRITIVPYFHTGGPWYIKSGDDASNAYLALYYNTTQLMRIKHNGTQMVDWNGNVTGSSGSCTGNAATATNADKVDNYHASSLWRSDGGTWNGNANIACTPTAANQEYSFDLGNAYTGTYWHVWSGKNSKSILVCYNDNMNVSVPNGTLSANAFSGPLTGNVTGNCSGSSGSCTGNAATATSAGGVSKRTSLTKGTNPSSTQWPSSWFNYQTGTGTAVADRIAGGIESSIDANGSSSLYLRAYRYASSSSDNNCLTITCAKDGTCTYSVSNAANFRSAIGVSASGTHADSYFVKTSGDTMSGNLTVSQAGESCISAKNTTTSADVSIRSGGSSGNHGLYSTGYGTTTANFTSSASWMIYRNSSGTVIVNGNCTGSSGSCTGNAATATTATYCPRLTRIADNTAATDTNAFSTDGLNVRWYSQTGKISGQPSQYGFLFTVATGASSNEVHQVWMEQSNGGVFHRGTNGSSHASPPAFRRLWSAGDAVTNAVWNDLAECRKSNLREPGYAITPFGTCTTKRLEPGCRITSDTWGFALGDENDETKMPVAISGRVLAYPARPREEYHLGDCVCSAPDGKVDIMTRQEIRDWPDCIIGIVNEIPDYEEWGSNEKDNTNRTKIKVNGRIWIDIK